MIDTVVSLHVFHAVFQGLKLTIQGKGWLLQVQNIEKRASDAKKRFHNPFSQQEIESIHLSG